MYEMGLVDLTSQGCDCLDRAFPNYVSLPHGIPEWISYNHCIERTPFMQQLTTQSKVFKFPERKFLEHLAKVWTKEDIKDYNCELRLLILETRLNKEGGIKC